MSSALQMLYHTRMNDLKKRISEEFLPQLRQPGQYVGLEVNARLIDVELDEAAVRFAMTFPDAYTIGVSHLGSQVLYHTLNDLDFAYCDRAYCPDPDAEAILRKIDLPLFGWETRQPLRCFDVLGFSLGYELCITNVLTMLDLAGIPLLASDRTDAHPLIVGGDALADTPEPLADFFDVFLPGEGEEPLVALATLLRETKKIGLPREETLLRIAREIPSAYVPRFYAQGEAGVTPTRDDVPATIAHACLHDLSITSRSAMQLPLVPVCEAVHERVIIEVMRGCPNLCRFCQAGHVRLPVRRRSVEEIVAAVHAALDATGYREVSLLSLSTSDYPDLDLLIERLNAELAGKHVSISLPSLRVDSQLEVLPKLTATVRKGGLTIAAEAGSEKLRRAIRKRITEEDMLNGVTAAWRAGYGSIKVYFMAGLPGETLEDIDEIAWLCKRLSNTRREVDGHRGSITASVSWLVPKPHTPMQWSPMQTPDYFWQVRERLIERTRKSPVNVKFHRIEQSLLEAMLCRGGREISQTILHAWQHGARMDSWSEHWNWDLWQQAITETHVDFDAIVHTPRSIDTPQPWSHIQCQPGEAILLKQRADMQAILAE
jgi:radical SAM family uncharacterized protein